MEGLGSQEWERGFGDREESGEGKAAEYQQRKGLCQAGIAKAAALCRRISRWRMAVFLLVGLFFYGGHQWHPALYLAAAAGCILFLLLIGWHNQAEERQRHLEDCLGVAEDYLVRLGEGWKRFTVDGRQYLKEIDYDKGMAVGAENIRGQGKKGREEPGGVFPEAGDLDLFGKGSLYQYICTAGTPQGQDQLARWFREPGKALEMQGRQQAVAELAQKEEFSWQMEVSARRIRNMGYREAKRQMHGFFDTLGREEHISRLQRGLSWLFPVVAASSFLLFVFGIYRQEAMACFLVCVTAQLLAAGVCYGWNQSQLSCVYRMNQVIEPYGRMLELLAQEKFQSPYLCNLQKMLGQGSDACGAFRKLGRIADSVTTSHNPYGFFLCNGLYLHDFHCVQRFAGWKARYRGVAEGWIQAIGEVEALISLGVISRTRQTYTLPQIAEVPEPVFAASGLKHPLIREPLAVGNDIALKHRAVVITGSNMSGKTTFLRSIGTNLILAYAGGFCTAQKMHVSPMKICTSMRTADDVGAGISTFYAELLRIKRMIQTGQRQEAMISLIDEIYKGTNSRDRIFAAQETIRRLSKPYAFTLLTTHDFELCDLENDAEVDAENYYFTEQYQQDKILFDYKIRKGRCKTTNARYLLQMAGILEKSP